MQDSSVETFTYTIKIPVAKYTVTVTNGSGTGQYAQGETVTITAGAAPSGQQFKEWEVVSGTITLASSTSETTTFTMPAEAVSVKANYEAIPVTGYTITATAGANGSITPSGAVGVAAGGSQTFTISPSSGYVIDTLKVDGLEVTATTSYTFSEVNSNHTIEVNFKQESQTPGVPDVTAPSITTQPGNATVKNTYQIIDGANSSWTHDSDGNITIRGNGDFSKFTGVKLDGNLIDKSNYTAKEGSTIITLKASYLNTLSAGTHTVEILWTDGSASTTFTAKANTSDNSNNNQNDNNKSDSSDDKSSSGTDKKDVAPETGDNTPSVWLFILSILSGTGLIITVKKRRENLNS